MVFIWKTEACVATRHLVRKFNSLKQKVFMYTKKNPIQWLI